MQTQSLVLKRIFQKNIILEILKTLSKEECLKFLWEISKRGRFTGILLHKFIQKYCPHSHFKCAKVANISVDKDDSLLQVYANRSFYTNYIVRASSYKAFNSFFESIMGYYTIRIKQVIVNIKKSKENQDPKSREAFIDLANQLKVKHFMFEHHNKSLGPLDISKFLFMTKLSCTPKLFDSKMFTFIPNECQNVKVVQLIGHSVKNQFIKVLHLPNLETIKCEKGYLELSEIEKYYKLMGISKIWKMLAINEFRLYNNRQAAERISKCFKQNQLNIKTIEYRMWNSGDYEWIVECLPCSKEARIKITIVDNKYGTSILDSLPKIENLKVCNLKQTSIALDLHVQSESAEIGPNIISNLLHMFKNAERLSLFGASYSKTMKARPISLRDYPSLRHLEFENTDEKIISQLLSSQSMDGIRSIPQINNLQSLKIRFQAQKIPKQQFLEIFILITQISNLEVLNLYYINDTARSVANLFPALNIQGNQGQEVNLLLELPKVDLGKMHSLKEFDLSIHRQENVSQLDIQAFIKGMIKGVPKYLKQLQLGTDITELNLLYMLLHNQSLKSEIAQRKGFTITFKRLSTDIMNYIRVEEVLGKRKIRFDSLNDFFSQLKCKEALKYLKDDPPAKEILDVKIKENRKASYCQTL